MPRSLTDDEVRRLRMRSQRLCGARGAGAEGAETADGVGDVVRHLVGIQAQSLWPSRLAVRPRGNGVTAAAVARACDRDRSVVRTWAMRGTLHMVSSEDVGWLVDLLGPRFAAADRRRRLELGLDDRTCGKALDAIGAILADGQPRTRADLVAEVAGRGVQIDQAGQAPAHLVAYAALRGFVCRGPDLDDEPTYVLLEDWIGRRPRLETEAAVAELARRYIGAYGPAGVADLAAWSGLPRGEAERGLRLVAEAFDEVRVAGEPAWLAPTAEAPGPSTAGTATASAATGSPSHSSPSRSSGGVQASICVRMLGGFDAYLLGYHDRSLALPGRFARRVRAGGMIRPAVVADGMVVGTWRQRRRGTTLAIVVEPFGRLTRGIRAGIEAECADLGRFLAAETTLTIADTAPSARTNA